MSSLSPFGFLLGRICISTIFILAAINKVMDYEGTAQYMASKGMTMVPVFLILAGLVEFIGGLFVLLGYRTRLGAILLLLFLIPTTIIFHDFWNQTDMASKHLQLNEFLKNLAIFGGLLYVLCVSAGRFSIDRFRYHNVKTPISH